MKKRTLAIIAFILALITSMSMISPYFVYAEKNVFEKYGESLPESNQANIETVEFENQVLPESDIPEVVGKYLAEQNEHISRIYEEEKSLYTVAFQNRDGRKNYYFFDEPVKYVATGRNNLANNIANQYKDRKIMFGENVDIEFRIDVRGQAYTQDMIDSVKSKVLTLTGKNNLLKFVFK